MKTSILNILFLAFVIGFSSCSEENIMLYHQEEEPPIEPVQTIWLLEKINYTSNKDLGITTRNNVAFSYTDQVWKLNGIDNQSEPLIAVDYRDNEVIYSMKREISSFFYYDSLLVRIKGKRAESALHRTYRESVSEEQSYLIRTLNDSSHFTYDNDGYLKKLERYDESGSNKLTYWEEYTVTDGNITEINTSSGFKHTYTYDNTEYSTSASYCYEMPLNTVSITNGGCWLLSNLVFLSDYTGKRSKNNIIRTIITRGNDSVRYGDITYEYIYDENNLVKSIQLKGFVNEMDIPDDYVTTFSYLEKEIKE